MTEQPHLHEGPTCCGEPMTLRCIPCRDIRQDTNQPEWTNWPDRADQKLLGAVVDAELLPERYERHPGTGDGISLCRYSGWFQVSQ